MNRKKIIYKSYNSKHFIRAWIFAPESGNIKGVVQIAHGMREHFLRYRDFAYFLVAQGFVVCGNDHIGHGSSVYKKQGYMGERNAHFTMANDMRRLHKTVKNQYPGVPYFLFGHSMGSFVGRMFTAKWGYDLDGLIFSGTGNGGVPARLLCKSLSFLCSFMTYLKGPYKCAGRFESSLLGAESKEFQPLRTREGWQTRDPEKVREFNNDPKSRFHFTYPGYRGILDAMDIAYSSNCINAIPKDLPVLIFSGDTDPVGRYGKGVRNLYSKLEKAGVKDLTLKLYERGRHEMLNELNRDEVYDYVSAWLNKRAKNAASFANNGAKP